jgi:2-polyprenyl-3-methyl-5-hydroxy-6-metoxy-1,4-benzoquinol methylase
VHPGRSVANPAAPILWITHCRAMTSYVFEEAGRRERARLELLESFFGPYTTQFLTDAGRIGPGLRCLDVGAGAGGVAAWMAAKVGPSGHVVALDLDTRFLPVDPPANLEVRGQNIVDDPVEPDAYDLIHARCLLEHLPARTKVLEKLIAALKPGGRIVVSDVDFASVPVAAAYFRPASAQPLYVKGFAAVEQVFRAVGADPDFGRKLVGALADHGLAGVGGAFNAPFVAGGTEYDWIRLTMEAIQVPLAKFGLLSPAEVEELAAVTFDPDSRYVPIPIASAWGTRPA